MVTIPGSTIKLPGSAMETRPTRDPAAWDGMFLTVELYQPVEAVRVSGRHLDLIGDWFALGDVVLTRQAYTARHSLPHGFRFQAVCTLQPGTIVNVGRCSALFGHPSGGYQAEFLDGPLPKVVPMDGVWAAIEGHA